MNILYQFSMQCTLVCAELQDQFSNTQDIHHHHLGFCALDCPSAFQEEQLGVYYVPRTNYTDLWQEVRALPTHVQLRSKMGKKYSKLRAEELEELKRTTHCE